jgi:hypothetical protein
VNLNGSNIKNYIEEGKEMILTKSHHKVLLTLILIGMLTITIASTSLFTMPVAADSGESWLSGWTYRKSHVINSAADAGMDYTVNVRVWRQPGTDTDKNIYVGTKCRTDFGDIRFTESDGITPLNYWREDIGEATGLVQENLVPFAIDSSTVQSDGTVFVVRSDTGNVGKIYKSNDGGATWTYVSTLPATDASFHRAMYCTSKNTILVNNELRESAGKIYRSTDNGLTWTTTKTLDNDECIWNFYEDTHGNVYASGYSIESPVGSGHAKLWLSTNDGASWTNLVTWSGYRHLHDVFVNKFNDYIYVCLGDAGLLMRSTDNGATWSNIFSGFLITALNGKGDSNVVYVGQDGSPAVYKFADTGGSSVTLNFLYNTGGGGDIFWMQTVKDRLVFGVEGQTGGHPVIGVSDPTWNTFTNVFSRTSPAAWTGFPLGTRSYWPITKVFTRDDAQTTPKGTAYEPGVSSDPYADFWVKIPDDLSSSSVTIYVYYGKTDATTTANGANTFIDFDDFEDSSITGWTAGESMSRWQESGGLLKHVEPGGFSSDSIFRNNKAPANFAIETEFRINSNYWARVLYRSSKQKAWWQDCQGQNAGDVVYIDQYLTGISNEGGVDMLARLDSGYSPPWGTGIASRSRPNYYSFTHFSVRVFGSSHRIFGDDELYFDVTQTLYQGQGYAGFDARSESYLEAKFFAVRKYVMPEPSHGSWGSEETLTIDSCRSSGAKEDSFNAGEEIWVKGNKGYSPSTEYPIYIITDVEWSNNMRIPTPVPSTMTTVTSASDGSILAKVWASAQPGKYDIVVDVDRDGYYDEGTDPLDNNQVVGTAGFFVIPEYALGTILALAVCFAGVAVYKRSKKNKARTL